MFKVKKIIYIIGAIFGFIVILNLFSRTREGLKNNVQENVNIVELPEKIKGATSDVESSLLLGNHRNEYEDVLINLNGIDDSVQMVNQEEGFVTQLGTVLVKKDEFKDVLLEPTPIVDENYIVKNQEGEPFCLVHQYDRIPEFKEFIYNKYK